MYRPLLRSVIDSFSKSHGRRNIAGELGFGRSIATTVGDAHGEEMTTGSIQNQIVHALFVGERARASTLLSDFVRSNISLTAHDFISILKYCAKSPDPLFAMETWSVLEEKGIDLNNSFYLLMTQALCEGGYLAEAYNMMNYIGEKHGINPSLNVYNYFLGACSKMHDMIHANKCLELMENRVSGKNEGTYLQLLKLAVVQKNVSAVHEIWKNYITCCRPRLSSLQKFVWSLTSLREFRSAFELLQYMVALALRKHATLADERLSTLRSGIPIPSDNEVGLQNFGLREIYKHSALLSPCTSTLFSSRKKDDESTGRFGLYKIESKPVMKALESSFKDVMYACAHSKSSGIARLLMMQIETLGLQPSSHIYDAFLKAALSNRIICLRRKIIEGLEVLKAMEQRNLKPCDSTLSILSVFCCKASKIDVAEALLDQIPNYQDPRPYNTFLKACKKLDRLDQAVRMLAKMKKLKVHPVIETYELLFALFGTVNDPYERGHRLSQIACAQRINAIEIDMERNGIQHNDRSIKYLLRAFAREGMIQELKLYLQNIEDILLRNNCYVGTSIYNVVLHGLIESREYDLAIEIFKNMKAYGVSVDAATYTIMIDCCSKTRCSRSASALVSLMLRDGIYPHTFAYTAIIKGLLVEDKIEEAWNLMAQGISEGIEEDAELYNTFLKKACKARNIDLMELILEEMHRRRIKPNDVSCMHVCNTYRRCEFPEAIMEAMEVLCLRMLCEEYGDFARAREAFEDIILAEDAQVISQLDEFFRTRRENLVAPLFHLRMCAIAGSPICWSPDETEWAKRLSTNYDVLKGKLLGRSYHKLR